MAITAVATSSNTTATDQLSLDVPTGTEKYDVMVAAVAEETVGGPAGGISILSQWYTLDEFGYDLIGTSSSGYCYLFIKTAGESEPSSYTFNADSGSGLIGIMVSYRGVEGVLDPLEDFAVDEHQSEDADDLILNLNSITVNRDGCFLGAFILSSANETITAPSGYTGVTQASGDNYLYYYSGPVVNVGTYSATGLYSEQGFNARATIHFAVRTSDQVVQKDLGIIRDLGYNLKINRKLRRT